MKPMTGLFLGAVGSFEPAIPLVHAMLFQIATDQVTSAAHQAQP
jgi:hypothetical protein